MACQLMKAFFELQADDAESLMVAVKPIRQ
jgi:hypothetical protein